MGKKVRMKWRKLDVVQQEDRDNLEEVLDDFQFLQVMESYKIKSIGLEVRIRMSIVQLPTLALEFLYRPTDDNLVFLSQKSEPS